MGWLLSQRAREDDKVSIQDWLTDAGMKKCQHCKKERATGSIRGAYGNLRVCGKCKNAMGIKKPKNVLKAAEEEKKRAQRRRNNEATS